MKALLTVLVFLCATASFAGEKSEMIPGELYASRVTNIGDKFLVSNPMIYLGNDEFAPVQGSRFIEGDGVGACRSLGFNKGRAARSQPVVVKPPGSNLAAMFNEDGSYKGVFQLNAHAVAIELECSY